MCLTLQPFSVNDAAFINIPMRALCFSSWGRLLGYLSPCFSQAGIELFYCLCCAPGRGEGHWERADQALLGLHCLPHTQLNKSFAVILAVQGGTEDSVKVLCHFQLNFLGLPPLSWFYLLCENSLHSFLRSALLVVGVVTWNYFEPNRFLCTTFSP